MFLYLDHNFLSVLISHSLAHSFLLWLRLTRNNFLFLNFSIYFKNQNSFFFPPVIFNIIYFFKFDFFLKKQTKKFGFFIQFLFFFFFNFSGGEIELCTRGISKRATKAKKKLIETPFITSQTLATPIRASVCVILG